MFDSPEKSINYAECHDGATVWDKMKVANSGTDNSSRLARDKMMFALVLLSEGVPFIHSGEEFCRTKQGVSNSYASPDAINAIDWNRKDKYESLTKYVKDLIEFRKEFPVFRLKTRDEIRDRFNFSVTEDCVAKAEYDCRGMGLSYEKLTVWINGTEDSKELIFGDAQMILMDENGRNRGENPQMSAVLPGLSVLVSGK